MFKIDRGFDISKMSAMEGVAVRLATFASNVNGVSNIPARFPNPHELQQAARVESVRHFDRVEERGKLARKILNLASKQQGLFYYVNSRGYMEDKPTPIDNSAKLTVHKRWQHNNLEDFWIVSDEERDLFSHLACQEAMKAIEMIDARESDPDRKTIYTALNITICRATASAGACAFWMKGSWYDMIVSAFLAIIVKAIGTSALLNKQERMVYEVVASFVVGLTAGLLALAWPNEMCFPAIGALSKTCVFLNLARPTY